MVNQLAELYGLMDREHWDIVCRYTKGRAFEPDITLAPDGNPYLYRWYVAGAKDMPTTMFHIQVASDPERPLHDHPWDNFSVILAYGYDEEICPTPEMPGATTYTRRLRSKGFNTVMRKADEAHRLILPPDFPYTMTLFSTGPKVREWGFWYPDGWHHNKRHVADRDGVSTHVHEPTCAHGRPIHQDCYACDEDHGGTPHD